MIVLDWQVMWCPRHLEPFRAEWPKGAGVAMLALTRRAMAMPAIVDAAGGDADNVSAALRRFAPICCFLPRDDLEAVYAEAGVWPTA